MPTESAVWSDYYTKFNGYFSPAAVRKGCEPRTILHRTPADDAIVLVHGLTDSPYFMGAIARYFFAALGYDVYMPLLHCHGLLEPNNMRGVSADEWKSNVAHAVETAAGRSKRVSIGGLSTGGTLSFYTAVTNTRVSGALYLFSAALDVTFDKVDTLKTWLLQMPPLLRALLESKTPLVGRNPFRYDRMDFDGAAELVKLIDETDALVARAKTRPFAMPVFAAHSKADTTADIEGIERLQTVCVPECFEAFFIPSDMAVSHASLVLEQPVHAADDNELLEPANPVFGDMMKRVGDFARRHAERRRLTA